MSRNRRKSAWGIPPTPEVCIGPSRRNPGIGRKEHISQRRLPPRDDASLEPLPVTEQQSLDYLTQGFNCIMARFDKLESRLEEINRRRRNVVYHQWQQEQYTPHRTWQQDHSSWHEQPPGWPPPPRQRSPPTGWPTQRRLHAYEQQQRRYAYGQQQQRNPNAEIIMLLDYQPPCPPYTDPDSYGQPRNPRNFDDGYQPPSPLPVSDCSQHPPQQPMKFIQSSQQRGLPNNPALKVRSLSPVQQAAINDYNEKLRVYRLEQAALLTRLNAWFEENINDENLAEDVPDIVAHSGGTNLDVPNDESLEEIVKTNNMQLQVLVGVNDEKIGDVIIPTHRELEMKEKETLLEVKEKDGSIGEVEKIITSFTVARVSSKDVENCWSKIRDGAYTSLPVIACVYVDLNVGDVNTMKHRPTSLDTDARLIPPRSDTPCLSIFGGVDKFYVLAWNFADNMGSPLLIFNGGDEGKRSVVRCVFDPGGDARQSYCFHLSSLLRDSHLEDKVDFNRGGVDTIIYYRIFSYLFIPHIFPYIIFLFSKLGY